MLVLLPLSTILLERIATRDTPYSWRASYQGIPLIDPEPLESSVDAAVAGGGDAAATQQLSDLEVVKKATAEKEAAAKATVAKPKVNYEYCDLHFGTRWLQAWNASGQVVCSPHTYQTGEHRDCIVRCRRQVDEHMPASSAPQLMCDVANLTLVPGLMTRAPCPLHRPGYMCKKATYHRYRKGAFGVVCDWPGFRTDDFPADHLRDIFDAFRLYGEAEQPPQVSAVERRPVLLVTREAAEYANVFHTFTDLLNAFITLRMMQWEGQERRVVLLDAHPDGPMDGLWAAVAAGGGVDAAAKPWTATSADGERLLRRVEELPSAGVLLEAAAFVPAGYSSLLYAFLQDDNECPVRSDLFRDFRAWLLLGLGLPSWPQQAAAAGSAFNSSEPLKVLLISRRPYDRRRKVHRQISNEDAVMEALGGLPGLALERCDPGQLPVAQQVAKAAQADILIGMHGAALTYSMVQQASGALVELWPQPDDVWRCFEHIAEWSGLLYRRWVNVDPTHTHNTRSGNQTDVDVDALADIVAELAPRVRKRKAAYIKDGDGDAVHPFLV